MIGLLGLNHLTAPIEIREKFSFDVEKNIRLSNKILTDIDLNGVVILSTCNRTELYFHTDCHQEAKILTKIKAYFPEFKKNTINPYIYYKTDYNVIQHLLRVASGLDSMIIGEDQILSQVRDALQIAQENNNAGKILSRLFQKALEAGKRVRTETEINNGCASVSSASIDMCYRICDDFASQTILFVGAGQTGELAIQSFIKKGGSKVLITNRTPEKAIDLARKYKGTAVPFEDRAKYYELADIIIFATAANCFLIREETARKVAEARNGKKQIYIDLSVPRNVCDSIKEIPNTFLYAMDDLQKIVNSTLGKRKCAVQTAEIIIDELSLDFGLWLNCRNLNPTIKKIKEHFHSINKQELAGFAKINSISDANTISNYANHITEKFTSLLIKNIKNVTNNGQHSEYVDLMNNLFELVKDEKNG